MADNAKTPPRQRRPRRDASRPRRSVDVRAWLGGIRFSGFMAIMLGLVVLAALVLVPTFGTYLDQRQRIAALEQSVQVTQDTVADLERERARWNDPAYITTQARERLYYVKPGEVVYLVDNDLDAADVPQDEAPVSEEVEETRTDWMTQFVRSVVHAGVAATAADEREYTIGVDDRATPTPTPSG
jgi:cell division protein FtsB